MVSMCLVDTVCNIAFLDPFCVPLISLLHAVIVSICDWITLGKSIFKIGICFLMASGRFWVTLLKLLL
jgi:hypothetical protein